MASCYLLVVRYTHLVFKRTSRWLHELVNSVHSERKDTRRNLDMVETSAQNQSNDPNLSPRHDILEVCNNSSISVLSPSPSIVVSGFRTTLFTSGFRPYQGKSHCLPSLYFSKGTYLDNDSTQLNWKQPLCTLSPYHKVLAYFSLGQKVPQNDWKSSRQGP